MSDELFVIIPLFVVAAGAGAGARHLTVGYLDNEFPAGTLLVNLVASAALGVVVAAEDPLPTVLGIGALGALSTWSTLANQIAVMARQGRVGLAASYLTLSVTSGVLAAWFGLKLGAALL